MKHSDPTRSLSNPIRRVLILASSLISFTTLTGCLVIGYTTRDGWFLWPGSISFLLLILLLIWLLRR